MLCMKCDHLMKRLITESTKKKEVWKCMKCEHKEEIPLWKGITNEKEND